jgi:hypothetical protein
MELSPAGGGGGGAAAAGAPVPPSAYTTITLYATGNALSLALFLMLYHLAGVLADFRDPALYAFLCSIALRGLKVRLVARLDAALAGDATLAGAAGRAAAAPLRAARGAARGAAAAARRWRRTVGELRDEHHARAAAARRRGSGGAEPGAAGASPRGSAAQPSGGAPADAPEDAPPAGPPSTLALYARAGLRLLGVKNRRRRRRAAGTPSPRPAALGDRLLGWMLHLCAVWAAWEWARDAWSPALQLCLATAAATAAAVALPLALLSRSAAWAPLASVLSHSPTKSPGARTGAGTATPVSPAGAGRAVPPSLLPRRPLFSPRGGPRGGGALAGGGEAGAARAAAAVGDAALAAARALDAGLRRLLRANLHALVSAGLIVALLLGSAGGAAFLATRIVQEGRGAVLAARDAFPAAWAGVVAATPALADALPDGAPPPPPPGGDAASAARAPPPQLPAWVAAWRRDALAVAQRSLPGAAAWLEAQVAGLVAAHNLTDALADVRALYEAAQGPRRCSERERRKLLVGAARAEVAAAGAAGGAARAAAGADAAAAGLAGAVVRLDDALGGEAAGACAAAAGAGAEECRRAPADAGALAALQVEVVAADEALLVAKAAAAAARGAADAAERARRVAAGRLALCAPAAAAAAGGAPPPGVGVAAEVGATLRDAYAKLWRRQLRAGAADLRAAAARAARGALGGAGAPGAADLSALPRLLAAAAGPLVALGRAAAGSVGGTAAAALASSLGLLRLGLGVFHAGVQAALFLTLLYYLLAARRDPLARLAALLPLPDASRARAAAAVNAALGGVFLTMLKLAALHGLLSWLSFRALRAPVPYASAAASAAFSLLPFVPTYAVALPGVAALAAQGRVARAAALFALHFLAYYFGDAAVLEGAHGGHPMAVSLAILGGMWAFPNPLLGCLLGPILLALLSATGALHAELMAAGLGSGSGGGGGGGGGHVAWATPPPTLRAAPPAGPPGAGALRVRVPSPAGSEGSRSVSLAPAPRCGSPASASPRSPTGAAFDFGAR